MKGTLAEAAWLSDLRNESRKKFETSAWPATSEEEWRRTDVELFGPDSYLDGRPSDIEDLPGDALPREMFDTESRIVFVNGFLDEGASVSAAGNVTVVPLDRAAKALGERAVRPLFSKAVARIDNRFQSLNYSSWDHGALVHIPAGVRVEKPILVDFVVSGRTVSSMPQVFVYAEAGSSAVVVQRFTTLGAEDSVLVTAGWEMFVGENASLGFVTVDDLGDESLFVGNGLAELANYARLESFEAFLGGRFVKSRLEVDINGSGADALLGGLFLADGGRHIDMRTVQRHHAPAASSRSYYSGAVSGSARSIYQGLIEVAPNASKTDAFLTNKNLVLNDGARADSIPSLEIKTNDVKCSHGSTTGKIREDQLFYLLSRGFSRTEARRILIMGFLESAVARAPMAVREELAALVNERNGGDDV